MAGTGDMTSWHSTTKGSGGTSFIWLHGWGQDLTAFDRLSDLMVAEGHHRLFDQPGFGKTPIVSPGDGTRDYADKLANLLEGTGPHIFVGHSFGVRVSIQLAAHYPELVSAIIGISGAGLRRKRSLGFKVRAKLLRTWGRLTRMIDSVAGTDLRQQFETRFGSADYRNAGDLRTTFVKVVNEDLSPEASNIDCPVCLLYGEKDTETPPEFGARYQQLMKQAEFHELPGYDHWDILTRGAYQCEAVMKRFLEKTKLP